jgi:hypothetical protein
MIQKRGQEASVNDDDEVGVKRKSYIDGWVS